MIRQIHRRVVVRIVGLVSREFAGSSQHQAKIKPTATSNVGLSDLLSILISFLKAGIGMNKQPVVHLVNSALRPGIVSISVGSIDPSHVGGGTDLYSIGERAVAHLDEHPKAIDVRHD